MHIDSKSLKFKESYKYYYAAWISIKDAFIRMYFTLEGSFIIYEEGRQRC